MLPAGGLVLLPKCPACLAAYIATITGAGISISAASYLRVILLTMCAASMAFLAARWGRRLINSQHRDEESGNLLAETRG